MTKCGLKSGDKNAKGRRSAGRTQVTRSFDTAIEGPQLPTDNRLCYTVAVL